MATFKMGFESDPDLKAVFEEDAGAKIAKFGEVVEVPTGDYNILINKPKINTVEVVGEKTGDDYHLQNKLIAGDNIKLSGTTISAEFEPEYASYMEVLAFLNS